MTLFGGLHKKRRDKKITIFGAISFVLLTVAISFVHPQAAQAATITATWKTTTTILSGDLAGGEYVTYTKAANGPLPGGTKAYQLFSDNATCASYIYFGPKVDLKKATTAKYYQQTEVPGVGGCKQLSTGDVTLTNTQANPDASVNTENVGSKDTTGTATTGTDGQQKDSDSCNVSTSLVSWFLCPIYDGLANLSDALLGVVQDFLKTNPIDISASDTNVIYQVWSNFRIYGDIFLIIALLVVVFGQSIGGGVIDAYTAKKVLPRLLVAAILINLSIYIVALMVDVTNIIGQSIGGIITAPLDKYGVSLSPHGWKLAIFAVVPAGAAVAAGGVAAFMAGGAALGAAAGAFMPFLLLFVIVPALLALILLFIVLALRKAIIIALVLISPIAFALYALPNTEQYFRKWWKLLFDMLMVYPVVMVIFGVADLLAYTVIAANGTSSYWGYFIAFLLQFLPLFMIPYAMKLASGTLGQVQDMLTERRKRGMEAVKGNVNDPNSMRNKTRYNARSGFTQLRGSAYDRASGISKSNSRFRRGFGTAVARGVGIGNLELQRSRMNEEQDKLIASQYSTGGDNTVRAFWAKQYSGPTEYYTKTHADGTQTQEVARQAGRYYTYRNADGSYKEWSAADVSAANSIVGKDPSRTQAYAKYEISKAANDGQLEEFMPRFLEKADEAKWSTDEANGVWAGVKFAHQQSRKELKYIGINKGADGKFQYGVTDHVGLSNELVDTMRKGDFASFRSSTAKKALEGYRESKTRVDAGTASIDDQNIVTNYQALADHLNTSLFGMGAGSEAARQAAAQAAQAAAGDETAEPTGYGLGASARAEAAWKDFVREVRGGGE
jgi:hypothetical protein